MLVQAKRGKHIARYPGQATLAPQLTNGDVIRIVIAWRAAIGATRIRESFPLWYQFAAAAYGWNPTRDELITSVKQRDASYPDVLLVEFWKAQQTVASALDRDGVTGARLELEGDYTDRVFQAEVQHALHEDGARASFAVPTPVCKSPDGSKTVGPKCKRQMTTWPFLCEEYEKCSPVVIDPITDIKRKSDKALLLAALIFAAWWAYENQTRSRRRYRT